MDRSFKIIYWNPGGVRNKTAALRCLAEEQGAQVILMGETKLTTRQKLRIPNYHCYRRDEVSPLGLAYRGTAALVRRDIIHDEIEHLQFTGIRTQGVRVSIEGRELNLFAGYRPPLPTIDAGDLSKIFSSRAPTLLAADLNAKHHLWGSRVINPIGRRLHEIAEYMGVDIAGPESPTHIPTNPRHSPDVLDIIAFKNLSCPIDIEVLYDLDEQHLPIIITLAIGADMVLQRPPKFKTNWEEFRAALSNMTVGPITTAEDVENNASRLTREISAAKTAASYQVLPSSRKDKMPPHLRNMLLRKRDLRKLWAHSRCPRIKTQLNALAQKLSDDVQAWRASNWDKVLEDVGEDPSKTSLYRLNRQLTRAKIPVCPLQNSTGKRCYRAEERAELLAEHLEAQFRLHPVPNNATTEILDHHIEITERMSNYLSQELLPSQDNIEYVSPNEVRRAVLRLPAKKAPGVDNISNMELKQLPYKGLVALARLFNGVLRSHHFPELWKLGKVIMLPKPGKDRRQPGSYRPITLLPHIAKLFERLLLRRLSPHLKLRDEQYGFRAGHSTTLQLTRTLHHLAEETNLGRSTIGVFLDIEKAFDRVWHQGLLYKLTLTTVPPQLIRTINSFLNNRRFRVEVENALSSIKSMQAGVPQGSCLSPALYGLYTNDIPTLREEDRLEGERGVLLALFADDSAYFASSKKTSIAAKRIQKVLDTLPTWLDQWRMAVNIGKTAALRIGLANTRHPPTLTLRNEPIGWESAVRYLGVIIDRSLRMSPQVNNAINQAKAARALLRPVLTSNLPTRTKVNIYKTYIRTRLTYAAPAWYALCTKGQKNKLQVIQNQTLRTCTKAGRYVRNSTIASDLAMESVEEFVVRLSKKMFDKADNGPHEHLRDLAPLHARPPDSDKRKLPRSLIPKDDQD